MENNTRRQQLKERDVRKLAPELDPGTFMQMYMESNFPQTASLPSPQQLAMPPVQNSAQDPLKLMKKPLSGTKYDNPGGF